MFMSYMNVFRRACGCNGRSVVLVPEGVYGKALLALACLYPSVAGRTVIQPNGTMVTVLSSKTSVSEVEGSFTLFLVGWAQANSQDNRGLLEWIPRATSVVTEAW